MRVLVLSPSVAPCSLRCPTCLGRPSLSTCSTGPGGPRAGPPLSGACRHLVFPRARASLTYDVPNVRLQGVLLYSISSIFSPLCRSSHAFHRFRSRLPLLFSSPFPLPFPYLFILELARKPVARGSRRRRSLSDFRIFRKASSLRLCEED